MNDYIVSVIRTWVPIILGPVITWLVTNLGVDIDTEVVFATVSAAVAAGYYALIRLLELKIPAFGKLLGIAKTVVYLPPPPAPDLPGD